MEYEALINGDPLDTIDPIHSVTIIINNGAHDYTYTVEQLQTLVIRPMPTPEQPS